MRNLPEICECYYREPLRPFVLATLFSVDGSHVYRPGATMAFTEDGAIFGSISAGCLEDDLLSHAQRLFKSGGSIIIHYASEDVADSVFGLGLGCGGGLCVVIERLPDDRSMSHLQIIDHAIKRQADCSSVIAWDRHLSQSALSPMRAVFVENECVYETIGDSAKLTYLKKIINEQPRDSGFSHGNLQCDGCSTEMLLTIHKPQPTLLIYGRGEIAEALEEVSKFVQWNVTVTDPTVRIDFPITMTHVQSAAVLLTHNDDLEINLLQKLLPSPLTYIGVLGSRSRIERIVAELERLHPEWRDGVWKKLHAPVGLDIGSETPQEIALSIVSEIVANFNCRVGKPLRECQSALHARQDAPTEQVT